MFNTYKPNPAVSEDVQYQGKTYLVEQRPDVIAYMGDEMVPKVHPQRPQFWILNNNGQTWDIINDAVIEGILLNIISEGYDPDVDNTQVTQQTPYEDVSLQDAADVTEQNIDLSSYPDAEKMGVVDVGVPVVPPKRGLTGKYDVEFWTVMQKLVEHGDIQIVGPRTISFRYIKLAGFVEMIKPAEQTNSGNPDYPLLRRLMLKFDINR